MAGVANAGTVAVTFAQVGSDVVVTAAGSLSVRTGSSGTDTGGLAWPSQGYVAFTSPTLSRVASAPCAVSPSSAFGTGGQINATSFSGDLFLLYASGGYGGSLYVRPYFPGGSINSTMTLANRQLSSLGLTSGGVTYTCGADTITVNVPPPVLAPTATTGTASSITTTDATLNGTVTANGASTTVTFEYGLTSSYGASGSPATASQSPLSSSSSSASVSAAITGLTCNTLYHFRVNANNGTGGTINGSDATFTTSACPAPTLSISNSPQTYTGSAISAVVSCLGGGVVSNVLYNGSSSVPSATGTYAITANCAASTNYSAVTGASAGNFVITQTQDSGTTPGGIVNAGIVGGSFVSGTAQFTTPTTPPSGQSFPYGVFGFTASVPQTNPPSSITVTLTYPQALPAGTKVWKDLNGTWLDWTNIVMISGNTITYTITDGGAGDADGSVNGSITDPLGPASPATSVPSLSEWAQLLLALMAMTMLLWFWIRERSH